MTPLFFMPNPVLAAVPVLPENTRRTHYVGLHSTPLEIVQRLLDLHIEVALSCVDKEQGPLLPYSLEELMRIDAMLPRGEGYNVPLLKAEVDLLKEYVLFLIYRNNRARYELLADVSQFTIDRALESMYKACREAMTITFRL